MGRESLCQLVWSKLDQSRMCLLHSPPFSGKSSFLTLLRHWIETNKITHRENNTRYRVISFPLVAMSLWNKDDALQTSQMFVSVWERVTKIPWAEMETLDESFPPTVLLLDEVQVSVTFFSFASYWLSCTSSEHTK